MDPADQSKPWAKRIDAVRTYACQAGMSAGKAVGDVETLPEFPTDSPCGSASFVYDRASTHGTRRDNEREDPFCSP